MDERGKTFKIVEREYGYKNQMVGSGSFLSSIVQFLRKNFDISNEVITIENWNKNKSTIDKSIKLRDDPLRNFWIHPFIILFLGFFVWLLFFVKGGFFAFLIGLFFLFIILLVINQLFQKLKMYFRYGTSTIILNNFPIKSSGELDLTFQNEKIINDFPVLTYTLQFIEEKKVRKQKSDGETKNNVFFKSWYREQGEFQTNYSGGDILLTLPSDLPGNTLYGNPLYYWTLDVESEKDDHKYFTTFFLPVD